MKNIYYDGSNVYFEIDKEDEDKINMDGILIREALRTFGFSKENRPLPLVNFGLVDNNQGIPIDFNVFKGNGHEKVYLVPLIELLKEDFNLKNFELAADRGNYSGNIIREIEHYDKDHPGEPEKYVIGYGVRTGSNDLKEWVLDDSNYRYALVAGKKDEPEVFKYKIQEIEVLTKYKNGRKQKSYRSEQTQLVYYSHTYAKREKHKREKKEKQAIGLIREPGKYTAKTNAGA